MHASLSRRNYGTHDEVLKLFDYDSDVDKRLCKQPIMHKHMPPKNTGSESECASYKLTIMAFGRTGYAASAINTFINRDRVDQFNFICFYLLAVKQTSVRNCLYVYHLAEVIHRHLKIIGIR